MQRMGEQVPKQFLITLSSEMPEPKKACLRGGGLSAYFVFRSAAQSENLPWGFCVKDQEKTYYLKTPRDLVDFFLKQGKSVQENGLWILGADLKIYSVEDKQMEETLKELCRQKNIPLFKTTTRDFPKGWKRLI